MINSRFTVAVHLLALLAWGTERCPGMPLTSEMAAASVNTNPVVVRRILGLLREAGLVTSQPGPTGGWFLARTPEQITLCDVYRAVEDEALFALHHRPPSRGCLVGAHIQRALGAFFQEAETAMEEKLAQRTITDVVRAVQACAPACAETA
jgi:Rrf2 family protein